MSENPYNVAHHEAAHAVVKYRAAGFVGGSTTIVPNAELGSLGAVRDDYSNSYDEAHMEARVLSCYAGAYADQRLGDYEPQQCEQDEAIAANLLRRYSWESREQELRDRSRALVEQHWGEIVAVAGELLQHGTLDDIEVELIADVAAGREDDVTIVEQYRARKNWSASGPSVRK
jgi:hypothetical protein